MIYRSKYIKFLISITKIFLSKFCINELMNLISYELFQPKTIKANYMYYVMSNNFIVNYVSFIDGSFLGNAVKSISSNSWNPYNRRIYGLLQFI